jgi:hypothetical protein
MSFSRPDSPARHGFCQDYQKENRARDPIILGVLIFVVVLLLFCQIHESRALPCPLISPGIPFLYRRGRARIAIGPIVRARKSLQHCTINLVSKLPLLHDVLFILGDASSHARHPDSRFICLFSFFFSISVSRHSGRESIYAGLVGKILTDGPIYKA